MTHALSVHSEIGRLRTVMLHRPGDELLNLSPDSLGRLLFDDIPFLAEAQREHDAFAQMLRDEGVEVLYLDQLAADAIDACPDGRELFVDRYVDECGLDGCDALRGLVRDVLLSGKKRDMFWKRLALVLLVFFLIGYLYIGFFSDADLMMALVLFFGSGFVTIVETLMFRLIDTARERSIDVTKVLVGVIDARDPYLNGHSQHVQALTMLLYRYLPRQMKKDLNPVSLEYAALLHDVGKLGVPEKILNKPAELDPQEWEVVVRHPSVGVKIIFAP